MAAKIKRDLGVFGNDKASIYIFRKLCRDGKALGRERDLVAQFYKCTIRRKDRRNALSRSGRATVHDLHHGHGVCQREADVGDADGRAVDGRDRRRRIDRDARRLILKLDVHVLERERGAVADDSKMTVRNADEVSAANGDIGGTVGQFPVHSVLPDIERADRNALIGVLRQPANDLQRVTVQVDHCVIGHVKVPVRLRVFRHIFRKLKIQLIQIDEDVAGQFDRAAARLQAGIRQQQFLRRIDPIAADIVLRFVLRVRIPCGHAHAQKRCQNERKKRRQQRCKTFLSCLCHKFPPVFYPNPIDRFSPLRSCRRARAKNVNSIAIFSHIKYNPLP